MLKVACKALSGKQPVMDEACQALSGKQGVDDKDVYLPLVTSENPSPGNGAFVRHLGPDQCATPAEIVTDFVQSCKDVEATAMPAPLVLEVQLPSQNWESGAVMRVQGPAGFIRVPLPDVGTPGATVQVRIAPKPEYRVQVPPGSAPGWVVKFQKDSGEEVAVTVPEGLQPGDSFDVTPPAMMVRVPEQVQAGDSIIFKHQVPQKDGTKVTAAFFRATVPAGCQTGDFFAAIMPKVRPE